MPARLRANRDAKTDRVYIAAVLASLNRTDRRGIRAEGPPRACDQLARRAHPVSRPSRARAANSGSAA